MHATPSTSEPAPAPGLLEALDHVPGIERVKHCIQCGTCSGVCPVAWAMEDTPRKIFGYLRAGMDDHVLDSTAMWVCASCYQCAARCPQEIKITDVMYALKRRAIRERRKRSKHAQVLSREFVRIVGLLGRNHEVFLMAAYLLQSNPLESLHEAPIGVSLLAQGRLPLMPDPIKHIESFRKIMAKALELGGDA
jgi:heterodisulfide reductase subunit C